MVDRCVSEVSRYATYTRGWDGYQADAFQGNVLNAAIDILRSVEVYLKEIQTSPDLMTTGPASDGSLDIELRVAPKTLFFTIYPDSELHVTAIDQEQTIERSVRREESSLARWLAWLVGAPTLQVHMEDD
jgi:hypothetical protein